MADSLTTLLERQKYVVLDGALATELESRGCLLDSDPLWSASILAKQPETIFQVHLDYFRAGADVAITSSYQASTVGLIDHGYSPAEAKELVERSVTLVKQARDVVIKESPERRLFIAGSVGPYGAYLANGAEYTGEYHLSTDDMENFHRPRIEALVQAGVDILAFETIPSFEETLVIIGLLKEHPQIQAWVSFTLRDASHISDGTPLEEVLTPLNSATQVVAIGINCVPEPLVSEALDCISPRTLKPLVVYPNSGEVYDAHTKTWGGNPSEGTSLEIAIEDWYNKGARFIGGCCRTTPATVRTIKMTLEKMTGS